MIPSKTPVTFLIFTTSSRKSVPNFKLQFECASRCPILLIYLILEDIPLVAQLRRSRQGRPITHLFMNLLTE